MDVIKTGIEITRTIKNVGRLREVLTVLARNGFDEFIIQSGLHTKIPGFVFPKKRITASINEKSHKSDDVWGSIGYRLRKSFEELGPGFIKLGQLLSTREDIFDESFISEMKKLQNQVTNMKFKDAQRIFTNSTGMSIDEVFTEFEQKPIATASIGSVFKAQLKSGEKVVVKIRKPKIKEIVEQDFQLFKFVVSQAEKMSDEIKYLGISRVADDFYRQVKLEMNFVIERNNLERLKENISKINKKNIIQIPCSYSDLSTEEVIVMEYIDGRPFNQLTPRELTKDLEDNLYECVHMFMHSMLADGFFHADLHGGNFLLLDKNRIGIVDFGNVGMLSKKNRSSLIAILYSLATGDFDNMVFEFLDIADYDSIPNHADLTREIQQSLNPYLGLSSSELNFTEMFNQILQALKKFKIYLPREWYVIFKAMVAIDGVGRSLGFDINAFEVIKKDSEELIDLIISKDQITEETIWFARDLLTSMRILPKHISWFLREVSKNNYSLKFENKKVERGVEQIGKGLYFLGGMILAAVIFYSGVVIIKDHNISELKDIPQLTLILWIIAVILGGYTIIRFHHDK
ncbi:MAG: hypothetical protein H6621_05795 [Halobacteriovoraceae bacterium]|nr:hypothetical protein [Halobacteriovoraceae bacterium]